MCAWAHAARGTMVHGGARAQLAFQVQPLVFELPARSPYANSRAGTPNLARIKLVASTLCLEQHRREVGVDRRDRTGMRPESRKLGVIPVTPRQALQHRPGQQPFPPDCDEAAGIEVAWMEGPKSHGDQSGGALVSIGRESLGHQAGRLLDIDPLYQDTLLAVRQVGLAVS